MVKERIFTSGTTLGGIALADRSIKEIVFNWCLIKQVFSYSLGWQYFQFFQTTLQEYVDGVFKSILCPERIPFAVRYFFQFLDREAARHRINDPEVVHIWKTNRLQLAHHLACNISI